MTCRSTDSERDALKYALKLLSYRGRSEREIREKLEQRGFPPDAVSGAVLRLKDLGYIDDHDLARNLRRQAFEGRRLGFRGARNFMLGRGISADIVDSVLVYDPEVELEKARKLLDKKIRCMGKYLSVKDRRNLWNFFIRRGFSTETARRALKSINFKEEAGK